MLARHRASFFCWLILFAWPLGAGGAEEMSWQRRIDAALQAADQAEAQWRGRVSAAAGSVPTVNPDNLPSPSLPASAAAQVTDIGTVAERFQGYLDQQARGVPTAGGLSVFVSLSMPKASLARLVDGAADNRATLVLRGMVDRSIGKTAGAVRKLVGKRRVAWTIDPDAFRRFGVQAVPVFVLTRAGVRPQGCGDDVCLADGDYVRLAGDVDIDYALDAIDRLRPEFHADVARVRGKQP